MGCNLLRVFLRACSYTNMRSLQRTLCRCWANASSMGAKVVLHEPLNRVDSGMYVCCIHAAHIMPATGSWN
jgi:hypothetical protein